MFFLTLWSWRSGSVFCKEVIHLSLAPVSLSYPRQKMKQKSLHRQYIKLPHPTIVTVSWLLNWYVSYNIFQIQEVLRLLRKQLSYIPKEQEGLAP
jgi:hypothetical protein